MGDLVSLGRQLDIECYNFSDTTPVRAGTGWTTDATHYVRVFAHDNHHGRWGGWDGAIFNTYRLEVSSTNAFVLATGVGQPQYTVVEGISTRLASGSFDGLTLGANNVARRCIVDSSFVGIRTGTTATIESCLALGPRPFNSLSGLTALDCTGEVTSGIATAFDALSGDMLVKNCLASGGRGFGALTFNAGCISCASSETHIPTSGTGHRASQTFTFVDDSGYLGDYHLAAADVGARGFGTDLSATITLDIDSLGIDAPWNIGADQGLNTGTVPIALTLAATGTATGGSPTGTGSLAVAPSLAGVGQQRHTGTGSVAVALSLAGTGLRGDIGSASVAVALSLNGSAQQRHTATGSESLALTLSGTSQQQHTATGTANVTLSLSGSGTVTAAGAGTTGTGDVAISLTLAGTSQQQHSATGNAGVALSLNGTGTVASNNITGTGNVDVALTLDGTADTPSSQTVASFGGIFRKPAPKQRIEGNGSVAVALETKGRASAGFYEPLPVPVVTPPSIDGTGRIGIGLSVRGFVGTHVEPDAVSDVPLVVVAQPEHPETVDPLVEILGGVPVTLGLSGVATNIPPRSPSPSRRPVVASTPSDEPPESVASAVPIVAPTPRIGADGVLALSLGLRGRGSTRTRYDQPIPPNEPATFDDDIAIIAALYLDYINS